MEPNLDFNCRKMFYIPVRKRYKKKVQMLTWQVCMNDIAINETSVTNIVDDTRILTKVMIGLADYSASRLISKSHSRPISNNDMTTAV
jgi:hypothetical protein